ncbi:Anaerobic dimethyl sulfoxide reductase chain B [Rubripirellula lacrimiformis]|uniref:Anaerobic dimethyl sulfoxide reductase chain B n=1 Tax=Rubripirellula lacrimiformis TaxID=1930273 RepID=A0A517NLS6_9BACT|nr:DmsC/YnfH family molybdoenzyme membrane anchor subunit [Rubripirellula lacrimiformis]QDT08023.1 Anaerobic dimethyl sulfoxide reductase chain B [Rubripirellula lacrimiformis]
MSIADSPHHQPSPDFISGLIDDQQSLSAVERFSTLHENGQLDEAKVSDRSLSGLAPAQERYYRDLLPASAPGPDEQFAFEVNLDKCSGCKACVVACHTMNGLEEDESWRRVGTLTIGEPAPVSPVESPSASVTSLPMIQHVTTACHHCEDPGCLNGCPVKAYEKDPVTGIVRHLDDQCIGCKYCMMMCPYEVPKYSERLGIVRKCDMCHQRLSVGEAPACVQACPNEAIAIHTVARNQSFSKSDRIAPGAPLSTITKPTTRYVGSKTDGQHQGHREGAVLVPQDEGVDQIAENHWPLAVLLVATQVSVGMLLTERLISGMAGLFGAPVDESITRSNATIALVVGIVGMNLAPLHLGKPLRAWRVFLGLRTSWLSREAVVLGKYVGLLLVAVGLLWLPQFSDYVPESILLVIPGWAASLTLWAAIPVGLLGLYCSAMIYIATKRELWRPTRTFVRFFGTMAVTGIALAAAPFAAGGVPVAAAWMAAVAGAFLIAKLVYEYQILLSPVPPRTSSDRLTRLDIRSKRLVHRDLPALAKLRWGTGIAGGVLILAAAAIAFVSPQVGAGLMVAAALLIAAGELAERLLYFSSVVYDRMPGTLG